MRPNTALAREAGVAIGNTGGIVTDARMDDQSKASGRRATVEPWTVSPACDTVSRLGTAREQAGPSRGVNTGGDLRFPGVVGTAVSKICVYEVARAGLTETRPPTSTATSSR